MNLAGIFDENNAYYTGYDDGFIEGRDRGIKQGWNQAIDKCLEIIFTNEGDSSTWKVLSELKKNG